VYYPEATNDLFAMAETNEQSDNHKHVLEQGTSFRPNSYLYRVLQPGQDFLEEDGFSAYTETVERVRSSGKKVILSIGESSTSGWDTTITPVNRERKSKGLLPISAFFRYRNFTDILRDLLSNDYEVLNAGVPGHSVLSGVRRLKMLRSLFERDGVKVDYTVVHYGNNDCLWEGNFHDSHHLSIRPNSPARFERFRRLFRPVRKDKLVLRTTAREFGSYYRRLIGMAKNFGARAIIVQPEVPIYWKPGSRYVDYDFDYMATLPGAKFALTELDKAKELWASVIDAPYSPEKIATLTEAVEHDFLIPRIKRSWLAELQAAARDTETPLVQTPVPRDEDEKVYFVDYCHPREIINTRIAEQIVAHVDRLERAR
jgi:hypothetical protein